MKPIDANKLKTLTIGLDTHQGETGKNNEDSCDFIAFQMSEQNQTQVLLGIVADGIGGHQAGERASSLAVDIVKKHFLQATTPRILTHLKEAYLNANAAVVKEGKENRKLRGMGTTMTAAAIMDKKLYIANVGDSRAYLIRNGIIRQLTIDHTWAQEAIDAGRLSPAEAKSHPNRNVIKRYMGIQSDMEVDFRLHHPDGKEEAVSEANQGFQLQDGDVILLSSDGLSDMVPDEDIQAIINKYPPQKAAEELVLLARKNGGFDNISVVIMEVPGKKRIGAKPAFKLLPIIAGVLALVIVGAGLAWAFTAGPLKTTPVATLVPTAVLPSSTPVSEDVTEPSTGFTATHKPAATETPPPSRTATFTPEPDDEGTVLATPTRLPTYTPTDTPTPTPTRPPATLTPLPTETPIPAPTDTGGGGGSNGGGDNKEKKPTRKTG
ncbi:MAG: serine/threonine-protein phosphatase [Anaerolineales bacterium]|nr:serine/threonine-protein phosphatase [Anaerolineales bacterium]